MQTETLDELLPETSDELSQETSDVLSLDAVRHFRLYLFGVVMQVLRYAVETRGSWEAVFKEYPFLAGYYQELTSQKGLTGMSLEEASEFWRELVLEQEETTNARLPIRALCMAYGLDYDSMLLLMSVGLVEEDARFGAMFEAMQVVPGQSRPTVGLLRELWQDALGEVSVPLRLLRECGLVRVANPESPRVEWSLTVPGPLWDALRGEVQQSPAQWARYHAPGELTPLEDLVIGEELRRSLDALPALVASGEVRTLVVRGPQHNGRRTLFGALARALGRGVLEVEGACKAEDERWHMLGPLAALLDAVPLVALEVPPGETFDLPRMRGDRAPLGVVLGRQGGLGGAGVERSLTFTLEMPSPDARRRLWARGFAGGDCADAEEIVRRFRMTSGNVKRAAGLAATCAALEGRSNITSADVQLASRALNRQALDTLATRVVAAGDWGHLAAGAEMQRELADLERRCRHRERLREHVGESLGRQLNCGVRALFSGPSGTGKTLAARLLAAALQMDLYRLDLSSVVNKYIGETEKSLNQVFARTEELDVILLIDEGDALLTQRTSVHTSNDRYANLETNYLLQRLECYEGIVLVTTNAGERIDSAFQRRMDVVIDFRAPEPAERWKIWQLHLPEMHAVERQSLEEVSHRCALTGGQIRNAVLHASLLALDDGGQITSVHLEEAVRREYRKAGAVCPLRLVASHTTAGTEKT